MGKKKSGKRIFLILGCIFLVLIIYIGVQIIISKYCWNINEYNLDSEKIK